MTKKEQAVRECCRTMAGDAPDGAEKGECQFRDALLAVLNVPVEPDDKQWVRELQISAAHTALGLDKT